MAQVRFNKLSKLFKTVVALDELTLEVQDKEFLVLVGPSGLRQVHRAAHGRPGWRRSPRARSTSATAGQRRLAEGPRHRHGVPELRALPAHDRLRQHGLRPEAAQGAAGRRSSAQREGSRRDPRACDHLLKRKPKRALRRPAPARRARARHRARAEGLPDGRAALQPRREAARADARRAHQAAPAPGHHHHLRHARPDRSHDHGRPHRGDERRAAPAGRLPR